MSEIKLDGQNSHILMTKLYELYCFPRNSEHTLLSVPMHVVVGAETSAEAIRKVVQTFQKVLPQDNIKGVEIVSFGILQTASDALVVV